jgi:hypothetical protein
MADEPNTPEEEVLELKEEQIAPPESDETEAEAGDDEEVVISFGDEAAPASEEAAPEWVRDLRKRSRELERENAELKKAKAPEVPQAGPEPTLESCDWDEDKFKADWRSWNDRKEAEERAKTEAEKSVEENRARFQAELSAYGDQKKTLGVKDFDSVEEEVTSLLPPLYQSILVSGAENKAKLIYALGKNPTKLRELASLDPIKFAFAAGKLEGQLKVERRTVRTVPESEVRGSAQFKRVDKLDDRLSADEWAKRRNQQIRDRSKR